MNERSKPITTRKLPMLTEESSLRLDMLRFPLIVGVVFIHNYEMKIDLQGEAIGAGQGSAILDFARNLISQGIARTSVPLFFLIAGYLFFYNFAFTRSGYIAKVNSRVKTLLLPFIFWNIATLAAIAAAQKIPTLAGYFSEKNNLITSFGWTDYICAVFGVGRAPISYQFWFIRDLMVLVLFAPLIFAICRYIGILFLLALFILWFLNLWLLPILSIEGLLFFSIGCWLGIYKRNLFAIDAIGFPIAFIYAFALIADTVLYESEFRNVVHKITLLLGIITALWLTKAAIRSTSVKKYLLRLSGVSFFVYAMHEPLLTVCRKLVFKIIQPQSQYVTLSLYIALPFFIIASTILLQRRLRTTFPRFMLTISGGR